MKIVTEIAALQPPVSRPRGHRLTVALSGLALGGAERIVLDWATLAALARPLRKNGKVLVVTANLNAGGAQRSLVNLAKTLGRRGGLEIAVAGSSTASYFFAELEKAGVRVTRSAGSRDVFDHAESLVQRIGAESIGTVCFWNVDPKLKLLLVKTLQFTRVRFVDVSPGDHSFAEMADLAEFQQRVGFDARDYHRRLDRLVLYRRPGRQQLGHRVLGRPRTAAPRRRRTSSWRLRPSCRSSRRRRVPRRCR